MDNKNDNNKINEETPKVITPLIDNSVNSTKVNNEPKVVEVSNTKEVNQQPINTGNSQDNTGSKKKKGHPIFLVLLMLFLFAFVFFLPEISQFITDYKKHTIKNPCKTYIFI